MRLNKPAWPLVVFTLAMAQPLRAQVQAETPRSETLLFEAPIRRVRLHPDEAWIVRAGSIHIPGPGTHRVTIAGLPQGLGLDDIRVTARGPAGTRLGEINVRRDPKSYQELPEWKRLQSDLAKVNEEIRRLELREGSLRQASELFQKLKETQLKGIRRRMATEGLTAQVLLDLTLTIENRSLEFARQDLSTGEERSTLSQRSNQLASSQQKLQKDAEARPTRVQVELEGTRSGIVELELAYRSRSASWHPAYEARLSPDRSRLELVLLAAVRQETEQDWSGVTLELASQGAGGGLELPPMPYLPTLSYKEGEVPKFVPMSQNDPTSRQAATSFQVPGTVEVPRNEEQRFRVTSLDLTPTFRYLALPRQSAEVYLLALVNPPPGFPLVPGSSMNLLQGQERLGTLNLEPPLPGEPLRLSFGAVPGLTTSRILMERGRKEVGDKAKEREWTFRERLVVSSTLGGPAEVEVQDRAVISATGSVTVDQVEGTTPGWKEPRPGLRSWVLQLAPHSQESLDLHTRIRGPLVGKLANLGDLTLEGN